MSNFHRSSIACNPAVALKTAGHTLLFAALASLVFFHSATAATTAREFTAHYESSKSFAKGLTIVSLQKTDDHYLYASTTTVTGFMSLFSDNKIQERSIWKFHQDKIRPVSYLYERSGSKERKVKLTFDWKKNSVTNNINADPWHMEVQPDTLDKFVYQLVMMRDLKTVTEDTKQLVYSIADGGKLKTYELEIQGIEVVATEIGTFKTIRVSRTNGKRTTTIWCAEELDYLPVRINQQKQGGSDYTANIIQLEGKPGFSE